MSDAISANVAAPRAPRRRTCHHCAGSGREPSPFTLTLERGELAELAAASGVHKSTLSRMLNGQTVPSLPAVILTARALGITETRLIRYPPLWHRLIQELEAGE